MMICLDGEAERAFIPHVAWSASRTGSDRDAKKKQGGYRRPPRALMGAARQSGRGTLECGSVAGGRKKLSGIRNGFALSIL